MASRSRDFTPPEVISVTQTQLTGRNGRGTNRHVMSQDIPETSAARRLTAYSYLVAFANDGTLDEAELKLLKKIALEDGVIDEEEKKVLSLIFQRASRQQVEDAVWHEIGKFKEEHGIS